MALMIVYVQYIYYTFLVLIIFIWLYDTTDVSISMVYPFSQLIGHWCVPKVLPHGLLMLFNVGDFVGLVPWIVTPDDTREWKAQNRGISPHSNVVTYSVWADLWNDYAPTIDVTRTCIIRSWVASIWAISRRFQSVMLHHSTLHFNWKHFETEVPSCCVKKFPDVWQPWSNGWFLVHFPWTPLTLVSYLLDTEIVSVFVVDLIGRKGGFAVGGNDSTTLSVNNRLIIDMSLVYSYMCFT